MNTSKLNVLGLVALLSCPALAWGADLPTEHAACGERTLPGSWAFRAQGTGPFGAFIAIGLQTFDAFGHLEVREFVTIGGTTMESRMSGAYELSQDCTGVMTTVFENGMAGTLAFVVAGDRIYALETDPGVSLLTEFTRIPPAGVRRQFETPVDDR
jgi:hypothetical protein